MISQNVADISKRTSFVQISMRATAGRDARRQVVYASRAGIFNGYPWTMVHPLPSPSPSPFLFDL